MKTPQHIRLAQTWLTAMTLACVAASPGHAADRTITNTIRVKANTIYDGKGVRIIARGMGDGSQDEGQKPIFRLDSGARVRNVTIGAPGCDGIHMYGNNRIENVTWQDIGEDAATVKGGTNNVITGGSARRGADKCFQMNAAGKLTIDHFSADDVGKVIRQNGGTTYNCQIYFNTVKANNVKEAIGRTDSSSTHFYYRALTVTNFHGSKGWWYGRNSQASKY